MTPYEKAMETLRQAQENGDYEGAHSIADEALCDLLTALGYVEVVAAWHKVGKWYA